MGVRSATAFVAVSLFVTLSAAPEQQQPPPTGGAAQGQATAGGERGRGRGGDPFAGQPRINALVVSGGCCHDYRYRDAC